MDSEYTDLIPAINMPFVAKELRILPVRTVCECSVGPIHESISIEFNPYCEKLLLIEPLPGYANDVERALGVKVMRVAIGEEPGKATMMANGGSSFLKGTWSPTPSCYSEFEVDVVTFDTLDDGKIDILNLDCEGQEWAVLSKMISRPKLLNIEVWPGNPHTDAINNWLSLNRYTQIFHTGPHSETKLYVRN